MGKGESCGNLSLKRAKQASLLYEGSLILDFEEQFDEETRDSSESVTA